MRARGGVCGLSLRGHHLAVQRGHRSELLGVCGRMLLRVGASDVPEAREVVEVEAEVEVVEVEVEVEAEARWRPLWCGRMLLGVRASDVPAESRGPVHLLRVGRLEGQREHRTAFGEPCRVRAPSVRVAGKSQAAARRVGAVKTAHPRAAPSSKHGQPLE